MPQVTFFPLSRSNVFFLHESQFFFSFHRNCSYHHRFAMRRMVNTAAAPLRAMWENGWGGGVVDVAAGVD